MLRKQIQKRIYVDDELPSFLTAKPHQSAPAAAPEKLPDFRRQTEPQPLTNNQPVAVLPRSNSLVPIEATDTQPRYDAPFLLKLCALTVGLNMALYVALNLIPAMQAPRLAMSPDSADTITLPDRLEERVFTYSNPAFATGQ